MTRIRQLVVVLLLFVAVGCAPVTADTRSLADLVTDWQARAGIDAVVVGIDRPGEDPQVLAAGTAQPDDRFRIGSITKTFVAATVLRLAEAGALDIDDPLGRWVSEPARFSEVTLRQLLGHTSGIPEYTTSGDVFEQLDRVWSPQEMIGSIAAQTPAFEPGTGWAYSNTNYILLGQVIEAVTGRHYGDVVDDEVVRPSGLSTGTGTDVTVTVPGWFDLDHDGIVDDVSHDPFLPLLPWAAGQMVSTADDLARFSTALHMGDVVGPDSLTAMRDEGRFGQRYGLGLQWSTPDGLTDVVGHGGGVIGYVSTMWWVPELQTSIVVLLNDSGSSDPDDLAELVLRKLLVQAS